MEWIFGVIMLGIYLLILYDPNVEKLPNKRYVIYYTPIWSRDREKRNKIII